MSAIAIFVALSACQRGSSDVAEPVYGSAKCDACGAVIDDARFAAQYRAADPTGSIKSFDDPACLLEALRAEQVAPTATRFRSYDDTEWLTAAQAWFVRTPATAAHGSGWAAYPSFAAAQEAVTVAGSGEILSFEQAKDTLRRAP
jgi:hypothetical protein